MLETNVIRNMYLNNEVLLTKLLNTRCSFLISCCQGMEPHWPEEKILRTVMGGMVKTSALYPKGRQFEPHRRRFFTPTVVLLSFNKPETVLWTRAKYYYLLLLEPRNLPRSPTCGQDDLVLLWKKKFCFGEKKFGSNTNYEIGLWFRFPIPKTGFGRTLAVGLLTGWPLKKYEDGFS